jgi:hypothetical protein
MCSSITFRVSLKTRLSCETFCDVLRGSAGDASPVIPGALWLCRPDCSGIVGIEGDADEASSLSLDGYEDVVDSAICGCGANVAFAGDFALVSSGGEGFESPDEDVATPTFFGVGRV